MSQAGQVFFFRSRRTVFLPALRCKIGIEAGSEGGWVAPLVAAKAKDIAYIVLYAGPALSYADEMQYESEDRLRLAGFSGDELKAALEFRKNFRDMIRSGEALTDEGWAKVQAMAQKAKHEKWFLYVRPAQKRDWRQSKLALMLKFDPQPLWEQTSNPVLVLYGERDRNVPAAKNVVALESALKKAGNKDYRIIVFPKANHEGLEAETGGEEEFPYLKRYVTGYLDTPINWILKRVEVSPQ
ncbi:MAG: alpha/beta hydrolase family protein [Pyrinomonadaceae bacterium]